LTAENSHNLDRPIGAALSRDIAGAERVEAELDSFISRRHNQRVADEGERTEEALWAESERRHQEKRRQMARLEWHAHHVGQADRLRRTLEELAALHEAQAAKLIELKPKGNQA
jgi:hypothetical protein